MSPPEQSLAKGLWSESEVIKKETKISNEAFLQKLIQRSEIKSEEFLSLFRLRLKHFGEDWRERWERQANMTIVESGSNFRTDWKNWLNDWTISSRIERLNLTDKEEIVFKEGQVLRVTVWILLGPWAFLVLNSESRNNIFRAEQYFNSH